MYFISFVVLRHQLELPVECEQDSEGPSLPGARLEDAGISLLTIKYDVTCRCFDTYFYQAEVFWEFLLWVGVGFLSNSFSPLIDTTVCFFFFFAVRMMGYVTWHLMRKQPWAGNKSSWPWHITNSIPRLGSLSQCAVEDLCICVHETLACGFPLLSRRSLIGVKTKHSEMVPLLLSPEYTAQNLCHFLL